MNYAIALLTEEKNRLTIILKNWGNCYPEERKIREGKLKDIEKAINEINHSLNILS